MDTPKQECTQPRSAPLPKQEWNFDSVPDSELVACCWWEYARESSFIRDTLHRYREWWRAGGKSDSPEARKLHTEICQIQEAIPYASEVFLSGCAFEHDAAWQSDDPSKPCYRHPNAPKLTGSFPDPWQSLSPDERAQRAHIRSDREVIPLRAFERDGSVMTAKMLVKQAQVSLQEYIALRDKVHRENPGIGEGRLRRQGKYPNYRPTASIFWEGGAECLSVKIEWGEFTNDEIVDAFRKWVKLNRPKDIPKPDARGKTRREIRSAMLRDLGVMRLLNVCTVARMKTRCPDAAKHFDAWESKHWSAARKRALRNFRSLFPFLPDGELPRHASTSGGRGKL